MKTLVFCTAFAGSPDTWRLRYRRWLDAVRASGLRFDQVLIVDDGSGVLPDWPDATVVSVLDIAVPEDVVCRDPLILYHFADNLGRSEACDFPGWYRSFSFAARYAEASGFEKVVHVESDAYLISQRVIEYVNACSEGWIAFWSPTYNMPETAIQIIAGDHVAGFAAFFRQGYESLIGKIHEIMLPYSHVMRSFIGDRLEDSLLQIPRNADYATQVEMHREPAYYWWLCTTGVLSVESVMHADQPALGEPEVDQTGEDIVVEFGIGGNSDLYVGSGWSSSETTFRWMVGAESEVVLPALSTLHDYLLLISTTPHLQRNLLQRQRLHVDLNGVAIADAEIDSARRIGIEIPRGIMHEAKENLLRFIHPDATAPSAIRESLDARPLAIAVGKVIVRRMPFERDARSIRFDQVAQGGQQSDLDLDPVRVGAHIQHVGDLWFAPGDWAGNRDSRLWLEGVIVSPGPEMAPDEIEYCAVRDDGLLSDWVSGGEFCGSRGENVPLRGLRFRLRGPATEWYELSCAATFTDGSALGPLNGVDLTCQSESRAPIEALQLRVRRRSAQDDRSTRLVDSELHAKGNSAVLEQSEFAVPDLTGEHYISLLQRLHNILQPKNYLEIGTHSGDSLVLSHSVSIAVDPRFVIDRNVIGNKPVCLFYQMPSDRFFAQFHVKDILGGPIDLAFLDGMHLFEFLLRDFINVEKSCRKNSIICLHDCIPSDVHMTVRDEADPLRARSHHPGWWTGDVWKVAAILKKYRPDLKIYPLNAVPTGLILITNLAPDSGSLRDNYFSLIEEFRGQDLARYNIRRYVDSLQIMDTAAFQKTTDIAKYVWL